MAEGPIPSQLTAASLKLYLDLPGMVRAALRDVDALGTPEDRHNLLRALVRAVTSTQYEVARRRVADGMRLDREDELNTDEAILVRLCEPPQHRADVGRRLDVGSPPVMPGLGCMGGGFTQYLAREAGR